MWGTYVYLAEVTISYLLFLMPQAYAVSVVNYWRGLAEIRVHPARIMMLLQLAKMAFSNYFEANNNNSDNKAVH